MKNIAIGIFILIIMGFAAKELITSQNAAAEPESTGYKFYYYPKLNMYYDATQNNFVYTVDGGLTWQTKRPSNQDLPDKISQKITIYSPDPDAWIHNSEHREKYKGVYTNYVQRKEDTAQFIIVTTPLKIDTGLEVKKEKVNEPNSTSEKKEGSWFKRLKDKIKKGLKKNKETPLPVDSI